jgi:L-lactate permease
MITIAIAALFGIVGGWLTDRMLRDQWGAGRIAIVIPICIVVGLIVTVPIALTVYYFTKFDTLFSAIIGSIAGPIVTTVSVRKWAPKKLPENDLRAR